MNVKEDSFFLSSSGFLFCFLSSSPAFFFFFLRCNLLKRPFQVCGLASDAVVLCM